MKNQAYRMAMLYDFYGDLLTERQKEFYDLYYNDDLSLSEIAENYDITRQGVRDIIIRAERTLEDVEEKTGLIRRYHSTKASLAALTSLCTELTTLNRTKLGDPEVERICDEISVVIDELGRE